MYLLGFNLKFTNFLSFLKILSTVVFTNFGNRIRLFLYLIVDVISISSYPPTHTYSCVERNLENSQKYL